MAKIGIFDSGVGGLSVFREIRKVLPEEAYIYYSDSANCPYGEKSIEFIIERCREITEFLLRNGADIIVVACNTATAAAIKTLRTEYSDVSDKEVRERVLGITEGRIDHVLFIGMEPAIKPAAQMTVSGVIGVLATAGTLKSEKYLRHKEKYASDIRIVEHIGEGFVELVEKGATSGTDAEAVVRSSLEPLIAAGADTIVLGCTHYPFLSDVIYKATEDILNRRLNGSDTDADYIRSVSRNKIRLIDPAPAIAKHLIEVMDEEGITYGPSDGKSFQIDLHSSGDISILHHLYRTMRGA